MDDRSEELPEARLERTKARIAARLRPVCVAMPEEEFDKLVQQIATIEIKYALRRSDDLFPAAQTKRRRSK